MQSTQSPTCWSLAASITRPKDHLVGDHVDLPWVVGSYYNLHTYNNNLLLLSLREDTGRLEPCTSDDEWFICIIHARLRTAVMKANGSSHTSGADDALSTTNHPRLQNNPMTYIFHCLIYYIRHIDLINRET